MIKPRVNKNVAKVHNILLKAQFADSKATRKSNKWGVQSICATRLYDLAKEQGAVKHKIFLTNLYMNNEWSMDIIWLVEHIRRVDNCDDSIPIIINIHWVVMDGLHRCVKAILSWKTYIRGYKVDIPEKEWINE